MDPAAKFQKRLTTLRNQLIGKGFVRALMALEFAGRYHTGFRKDGVTPEFDHQVSIALYILTLPELIDPEGTIVTVILHDTPEDYPVVRGFDLMQELFYDPRDHAFGRACVASIELLNKYELDGKMPKDEDVLYAAMARDPRASIAKPADRVHNLQTMIGVFSTPKQIAYIDFAEKRILPLMKAARRIFPRQGYAYENIKWMLKSQIELIRGTQNARQAEVKT